MAKKKLKLNNLDAKAEVEILYSPTGHYASIRAQRIPRFEGDKKTYDSVFLNLSMNEILDLAKMLNEVSRK